jgi:hypothetical protein
MLPDMQVQDSPVTTRDRQDITLWKEADISRLGERAKRRFLKQKSALAAYFTTGASLDKIAQQHHISEETLTRLAEKCLMQHEDGTPWGFRALLPGVRVVDHAASSSSKQDAQAPTAADQQAPAVADDETQEHTVDAPSLPMTDKQFVISPAPVTALEAVERDEAASTRTEEIAETAEAEEDVDTAKREAVLPDPSIATLVIPETPAADIEDDETEPVAALVNNTAEEQEQALLNDRCLPGTPPTDPVGADSSARPADVSASTVFEEEDNQQQDQAQDQLPAVENTEVPATGGTSESEPESETAAAHPEEAGEQLDAAELAVERLESEEGETGADNENEPSAGALIITDTPGMFVARPEPVMVRAGRRSTLPRRVVERHVHRHWQREAQQQRRKRLRTILATSLIVALLVLVALPAALGLAAYSAYSNVRGVAMDGVDRLLKVKTILSVAKSDPLAALDVTKLQQAQVEFKGAESDFVQLEQLLNRPGIQATVNQFSPKYGSELAMAQRLVRVGLDVSRMGNEVSNVALMGANLLHSSPLSSSSNKPLITVADVSSIEGALVHALYYIDDIQAQMSQVSLQDLPISTSQKAELASVMPLLPKARDYIVQVQGMVGLVAWLLGVGQPRRFLVQTLDSAELRPSGGFAGQYGILQIQDGRIAPFTLRDVALLDYAGNGSELVNNGPGLGRSAPPQYRSWMNFGYFGLRDSNLSGDYPTTARLNMQIFQDEGGGPVDGDIELTPAVISHVLLVTGPIKVAEYNDVVTAQNLESKLHYYQQNYAAIAVEKQKTNNSSNEARKAFTSLVGQLLMSKVRHLPVSKLIQIGKYALQDIKSRDLQIYFTNPAAEAWLVEHGYSGAMSTFSQTDGFMVVQANISISKASQYVHTTEQDQITLDAHGGATHTLTITLNYQQTGPVYGFDTYADYVRIYAPAGSQFLWGDGFDTGKPLCKPTASGKGNGNGNGSGTDTGSGTGSGTGTTTGCSQYNTSFPDSARYCPNGDYRLGDRFTNLAWPIDSLGPPTQMTSDLPGRAMWGGLTETPKNCITTITVSYYVPHAVRHVAGQPVYSLLVQKQGGYIPTVDITIDTSAIKGLKPYHYNGKLSADKLITLTVPPKK